MNSLKYLLLVSTLITLSCHQSKDTFSLCGIGITMPYYESSLSYRGELYQIKKVFRQQFIPPSTKATGIAKARFKVNCEGELGEIKYEEYNLNYIKTELNDSIETQVINIVAGLQDWIPGTNRSGENINSHSFLALRIIDGEIVEFLPK